MRMLVATPTGESRHGNLGFGDKVLSFLSGNYPFKRPVGFTAGAWWKLTYGVTTWPELAIGTSCALADPSALVKYQKVRQLSQAPKSRGFLHRPGGELSDSCS